MWILNGGQSNAISVSIKHLLPFSTDINMCLGSSHISNVFSLALEEVCVVWSLSRLPTGAHYHHKFHFIIKCHCELGEQATVI